MDLFKFFYVDGMVVITLAMPTLLVAMMFVTRPAKRASSVRSVHRRLGSLASARS